MRTFAQMQAFLAPHAPDDMWFEPGPDLPDVPGRFTVLTRYGGPGEDLEGAMDGISWQVRVAGLQGDYNDAEAIADAYDVALLNILSSDNPEGVHVAGVQRVGGAPNPLLKDDADRWQFVCSYILHTELALNN